MKIIHLITELKPAGAEHVILDLCKGFRERGHVVDVISLQTLPEKSVIIDGLHDSGVKIHSLNLKKYQLWKMFALKKLFKKLLPDIVHSHLIHPNIISRINATDKHFKLVNTIHIAEKRKGKKCFFWLDKKTAGSCDAMTTVSHAVKQFHAQKLDIDENNFTVIYNGIEPPRIPSKEEVTHLKKVWDVADCAKILGSVGRLDFQKGYDILLEMLPEISKIIPENEKWALVILGEGTERRLLERQSYKCPPNMKILLPGYRSDAKVCIAAFDVFCMPSRYEGFGLTLAEAMGQGVPIVAANVDSLPELLANYQNGEVVDFLGDKKVCVEAIKKHIGAPKIEPVIFSSNEEMIENYLNLYKSL